MDEHVFNFTIISLVTLLLENCLVQLNSLELDHNETNIHSELEENKPNAFRNEFVCGGAQVNRRSPENSESSDHKDELCKGLGDPFLLVPWIKCFDVFKIDEQLHANHGEYNEQFNEYFPEHLSQPIPP